MANAPRDVAKKLQGGQKTPADIARTLNDKLGKPLDIGTTKTPLQESGTVLPPIKKGK